MIQITLMDDKEFINAHKNFKESETQSILAYVRKALYVKSNSIIEVRKWPNKTIPEPKEKE